MEIIPAIIPKDSKDLKDKLESVKEFAKTVHIDFTENLPLRGVPVGGGMFLEAHLMVTDPVALIPSLVKDGFSRILIQVESVSAAAFAEIIHEWRGAIEIGAALKIETPLEAIDSFAHELTTIQLMSIAHIGKQGEPFDERAIARVVALHAKCPHLTISVDGGVNKENAKRLAAAGATRLVVGSAFKEFYG
ncbi:MAG: ribulose-phosphate 3-epimerase [Parcubacteria group bacterium Gr01-1014_17]|nr:MAG: ribulose-phosphate 3-epimerase [Parcubacteria group bacterium Gr01-1014_17]